MIIIIIIIIEKVTPIINKIKGEKVSLPCLVVESKFLEGKKGLAYWCMSAITLLPTLCFSFSLFSFSRFCYFAFPLFSFFSSCSCDVVFWCCGDVIVVRLCYCARRRLLIYCLP